MLFCPNRQLKVDQFTKTVSGVSTNNLLVWPLLKFFCNDSWTLTTGQVLFLFSNYFAGQCVGTVKSCILPPRQVLPSYLTRTPAGSLIAGQTPLCILVFPGILVSMRHTWLLCTWSYRSISMAWAPWYVPIWPSIHPGEGLMGVRGLKTFHCIIM